MCGHKSEGGDLGGVCLVGSVVVHGVGGVVVIGERWLVRRNFESRFSCRRGTWRGLLAYGKWARSRGRLESMVTGGFYVAELCVAERNSGWVSCGVCFVASLCANSTLGWEDEVVGTRRVFEEQHDVARAKRPDTLVREFCEGLGREVFGVGV